jgi:hypothetical protein
MDPIITNIKAYGLLRKKYLEELFCYPNVNFLYIQGDDPLGK